MRHRRRHDADPPHTRPRRRYAGICAAIALAAELMADGALDPLRPEVLVYAGARPGDPLRLVALEYFAADPDGDAATDDRPELFGQPFDGPFGGPGEAPVYLLHAWVHRHNPAGVFAPFNPRLHC